MSIDPLDFLAIRFITQRTMKLYRVYASAPTQLRIKLRDSENAPEAMDALLDKYHSDPVHRNQIRALYGVKARQLW